MGQAQRGLGALRQPKAQLRQELLPGCHQAGRARRLRGMAEEELSPAQKLALGSNFVLNSPPAQSANVVDGKAPLLLACALAESSAEGRRRVHARRGALGGVWAVARRVRLAPCARAHALPLTAILLVGLLAPMCEQRRPSPSCVCSRLPQTCARSSASRC